MWYTGQNVLIKFPPFTCSFTPIFIWQNWQLSMIIFASNAIEQFNKRYPVNRTIVPTNRNCDCEPLFANKTYAFNRSLLFNLKYVFLMCLYMLLNVTVYFLKSEQLFNGNGCRWRGLRFSQVNHKCLLASIFKIILYDTLQRITSMALVGTRATYSDKYLLKLILVMVRGI